MNNLKEFKELIEKYNSITIEDIKSATERAAKKRPACNKSIILRELTGFGTPASCTLCLPLKINSRPSVDVCNKCTWVLSTGFTCWQEGNKDSYQLIDSFKDADELIKAIKYRAEYMQEVLAGFVGFKRLKY